MSMLASSKCDCSPLGNPPLLLEEPKEEEKGGQEPLPAFACILLQYLRTRQEPALAQKALLIVQDCVARKQWQQQNQGEGEPHSIAGSLRNHLKAQVGERSWGRVERLHARHLPQKLRRKKRKVKLGSR